LDQVPKATLRNQIRPEFPTKLLPGGERGSPQCNFIRSSSINHGRNENPLSDSSRRVPKRVKNPARCVYIPGCVNHSLMKGLLVKWWICLGGGAIGGGVRVSQIKQATD